MKFKNLLENYDLKKLNTFHIGGKVKYFFKAKSIEELLELLNWAKEQNERIILIGNGSDILFSDSFIDAILIKLDFHYFEKISENQYKVSSAYNLKDFILKVLKDKYKGLEKLMGIPGTVGGAIWANAGAYGVEISNFFQKANIIFLDENSYQIRTVQKSDCNFKYRDSIFKHRSAIILDAVFSFQEKVDNYDLLKDDFVQILKSRQEKHPLNLPNAGSIFKNVLVNDEIQKKLGTDFAYNKIPAAWLIEKVNLKSYRIGGAQFSEKHANFIVNINNAKAEDVLNLIKLAKQKVKEKFNLELEEELIYIE